MKMYFTLTVASYVDNFPYLNTQATLRSVFSLPFSSSLPCLSANFLFFFTKSPPAELIYIIPMIRNLLVCVFVWGIFCFLGTLAVKKHTKNSKIILTNVIDTQNKQELNVCVCVVDETSQRGKSRHTFAGREKKLCTHFE